MSSVLYMEKGGSKLPPCAMVPRLAFENRTAMHFNMHGC